MAKKPRKKAAVETAEETVLFDRLGFSPEVGKHYRIHFRNGNSGEYNGQALDSGAPFPWAEVVSVDEIKPSAEAEAASESTGS